MASAEGSMRAARVSRGWSQAQAVAALVELAARRGLAVASASSLKTQLSRWENQHVAPEHTYRVLLRELYGRSDDELGLTSPAALAERDEAELLRTELAAAGAADDQAVELLRAQLAATTALDTRHGAAAVAESAHAQLTHLERVLAHAVSRRARRPLACLLSSAAMLAARVAVDRCLPATAWRHLERARLAGHDAEDPVLAGCAIVEQAQVATEVGRGAVALELIGQAGDVAGTARSSLLRAWVDANRGDALAAVGSAGEARSAYRAAERRLADVRPRVDLSYPLPVLLEFDLAALRRHRGHGLHVLRDDAAAIADLRRALDAGGGSTREVAEVHVDLAHAFSATDQPAAAAAHAREARALADQIGSTRLTARLDAGFGS